MDHVEVRVDLGPQRRTIRTIFIGGWITLSIWIITNGVVKLVEKPPWVAIVTALIAALGAGVIQTPILLRVKFFIKGWTRRNLSRIARLEDEQDPGRTSSGMLPDGTEPPERPNS